MSRGSGQRPSGTGSRISATGRLHGVGVLPVERACLTLPVLPGRTGAALALMESLAEERRAGFELLLRRLGITRQAWFLASGPCGDELVGYFECAAWADAFDELIRSRHPFDTWLKATIAEVTGMDFADLPIGLPQPRLLLSYTA